MLETKPFFLAHRVHPVLFVLAKVYFRFLLVMIALLFLGAFSGKAAEAGTSWVPSGPFMAASSQIDRLTILAVVQVLIDFFLVGLLAVEMFLILNLGLLSKRSQDRPTIPHPEPSDLNVLKRQIWPEEPEVVTVLPAADESYERPILPPSEEEKEEAA